MNRVTPAREPIFHPGEVALQNEAGVAERNARFAAQMIRGQMPEQHREFFPHVPFVIVASIDERGQPTASLLAAPPGFAWSPDPSTLRLESLPLAGDPLEQNLRPGAPLGVLGIQAHTRRRNRVNGTVATLDHTSFSIHVQQSFGNCPKYIHPREAFYVGAHDAEPPRVVQQLGERERALIAGADTFFIASAHPGALTNPTSAAGVDASHRGGPPGFVHFTAYDSFEVSDYSGNNLYMTLGNLRLNPHAGLLFIDRVSGDLLQLEASVELIAGVQASSRESDSGRVLRFCVQRARTFRQASRLAFGAESS
jgi:predicted pyridoxine 5'-phosphate oxidase superfamily flavin-nucleotide-binding protein